MRLDVVTIFPEYLDPLRHALLGKAIEQGILSVGVHDLRQWATDVHKSVDDSPFGGGPGMVMKPTVWGPALDDIAQGATVGTELHSATQHLTKPRHDDVAGVDGTFYEGQAAGEYGQEDPSLPLLIVPTPAGVPFSQSDAQAWSREDHIVFACGRYEGIDQRVVEDARKRYRVREVSIGDYVLIGGEVAVLVMAEAIVRLIPGVLGNKRSHEEDSFSDGLLEGPSYTKPRTWRGLDVPEVLTSGNHAAIDRWRREQSLLRTAMRRPELLENIELSKQDKKFLSEAHSSVAVSVDLSVLISEREWKDKLPEFPQSLTEAGIKPENISLESIDSACSPENILVAEYQDTHGSAPVGMGVFRLIVNGYTDLPLAKVSQAVAAALPAGTLWYGTAELGHTEFGTGSEEAWSCRI